MVFPHSTQTVAMRKLATAGAMNIAMGKMCIRDRASVVYTLGTSDAKIFTVKNVGKTNV